jgi:hypothetical protein
MTSLALVTVLIQLNYRSKVWFKILPPNQFFAHLDIHPPKSMTDVRIVHSPPALIGERYGFKIVLDPRHPLLNCNVSLVDNTEERSETQRRASVDQKPADNYIVYNSEGETVGLEGVKLGNVEETTTLPLEIAF